MTRRLRLFTAVSGLLSVSFFVCSFMLFGFLHPDFDVFVDFISKLGAKGQPNAFCWNIVGFGSVGLLLAAFGWLFGLCKNDRVLGTCLMVAGFGFSLGAIPTDFADAQSPLSKAHFVSICLSLTGYCFGMARLTGSQSTDSERITANWVIALAILPIIGASGGVSAEPVAHRIILTVVFTWVVLSSLRLLTPLQKSRDNNKLHPSREVGRLDNRKSLVATG
ncbi:MAG: DUF998 domain-containing protein [Cyanobacteria bacterium J06638_20]